MVVLDTGLLPPEAGRLSRNCFVRLVLRTEIPRFSRTKDDDEHEDDLFNFGIAIKEWRRVPQRRAPRLGRGIVALPEVSTGNTNRRGLMVDRCGPGRV